MPFGCEMCEDLSKDETRGRGMLMHGKDTVDVRWEHYSPTRHAHIACRHRPLYLLAYRDALPTHCQSWSRDSTKKQDSLTPGHDFNRRARTPWSTRCPGAVRARRATHTSGVGRCQTIQVSNLTRLPAPRCSSDQHSPAHLPSEDPVRADCADNTTHLLPFHLYHIVLRFAALLLRAR